jgi:peroxiredoxin
VFLEEARARADSMTMVLVGMEPGATLRGMVEAEGIETPVVQDERAELLEAWQFNVFPILVFMAADGSVIDTQLATFDGPKLAATLDALAAGQPLPEPNPLPPARSSKELTDVLVLGEVAPELRAPALGGGELSTEGLRGRPTVVAFFPAIDATGDPADDDPPPDRLLEEAGKHAGVNVLLVVGGERSPGAVGEYMADQGSNVPVIFDWDGSLKTRWGLVLFTTVVVLDADGRAIGWYDRQAVLAPGPLFDAIERGDPLPAPDRLE